MKTLLYIFSIEAILILSNIEVRAQCNAHEFENICIPQLPSGFSLLKSYKIDNSRGTGTSVEYSQVLSKGSEYIINICAEDKSTDAIAVSLYNSDHEEVKTKLLKREPLPVVSYSCKETGIYYILYSFDTTTMLCGGSALGFRRSR